MAVSFVVVKKWFQQELGTGSAIFLLKSCSNRYSVQEVLFL